jgi:hypothetical protein
LHVTDIAFQIFAGSALGFLIAATIGAAFLAVWFTKASNLWQKSEELWEGGSSWYLLSHISSTQGHRFILSDCRPHNFCHGYQHAQVGPRKDQVARQAPTRFRGTA